MGERRRRNFNLPIAESTFGHAGKAAGGGDVAFVGDQDFKDEGFVIGGVTTGHEKSLQFPEKKRQKIRLNHSPIERLRAGHREKEKSVTQSKRDSERKTNH
jgi:hypothetical protein